MNKTKFTPGPWIIFTKLSSQENHKGFILTDANKMCVADVEPIDEDGAAGIYNAHLIAAAPDLYEALANLKPYLDSIVCYASTVEEYEANNFVFKVESALKKARGEIWL